MNGVFTTLQNLFRRRQNEEETTSDNTDVAAESVQVPIQQNQSPADSENLEAMTGRLADARAADDNLFKVHAGPAVATIRELARVLAEAPDETFAHHLSGDTDDFARWVQDVFADKLAADKLREAQNPSEIVYVLDVLSK